MALKKQEPSIEGQHKVNSNGCKFMFIFAMTLFVILVSLAVLFLSRSESSACLYNDGRPMCKKYNDANGIIDDTFIIISHTNVCVEYYANVCRKYETINRYNYYIEISYKNKTCVIDVYNGTDPSVTFDYVINNTIIFGLSKADGSCILIIDNKSIGELNNLASAIMLFSMAGSMLLLSVIYIILLVVKNRRLSNSEESKPLLKKSVELFLDDSEV